MLREHSKRNSSRYVIFIPILYDTPRHFVTRILPLVSESREQLRALAGEQHHGMRLDRALSELFPLQSRNFLAKLITAGKVSVDGTVALKPSQRIETGQ